jgi:hypothetical protein
VQKATATRGPVQQGKASAVVPARRAAVPGRRAAAPVQWALVPVRRKLALRWALVPARWALVPVRHKLALARWVRPPWQLERVVPASALQFRLAQARVFRQVPVFRQRVAGAGYERAAPRATARPEVAQLVRPARPAL